MIEIEKLILQRRTIHEYLNESVSPEIVAKALELATWAPNHKLTKPWRFVLCNDAAKKKVLDLAIEVRNKKSPLSASEVESLRTRYQNVPILVGVAMKRSESAEQSREDYAAVAAGLQNSALYLTSLGLGSKWSTGALIRHPAIYDVLNLEANDVELVGLFWIGKAAKIPNTHGARFNFDARSVITWLK